MKIQVTALKFCVAVLQHFHIEERTDPDNCCARSNGKLANAGKGQAAKPANAWRGINQYPESGSFLRTSALTASFLKHLSAIYQVAIERHGRGNSGTMPPSAAA